MELHVLRVFPSLVEIQIGERENLFLRYRPYRDRRGREKVQLFAVVDIVSGRVYGPYERDLPDESSVRQQSYKLAHGILWGRKDLCAARQAAHEGALAV